MSKFAAVQGMVLQIVNGLPTPVIGVITILGIPSIINKVNNNGVYLDGLQIQVTNITSGSATIPDPGPVLGTLNALNIKCKENGVKLLAVDDITAVLSAIPKIPAVPTPIDYPVTFQVKIVNANQAELKVN